MSISSTLLKIALAGLAWASALGDGVATLLTPAPEPFTLSESYACEAREELRLEQFRRAWRDGAPANLDPFGLGVIGNYVLMGDDGDHLLGPSMRLRIRADGSYERERCGCTGCSVEEGIATAAAGGKILTLIPLPYEPGHDALDCYDAATTSPLEQLVIGSLNGRPVLARGDFRFVQRGTWFDVIP